MLSLLTIADTGFAETKTVSDSVWQRDERTIVYLSERGFSRGGGIPTLLSSPKPTLPIPAKPNLTVNDKS